MTASALPALTGNIAVIPYSDTTTSSEYILVGSDASGNIWSAFSNMSIGGDWQGQILFPSGFYFGLLQAPSLCLCGNNVYLGFTMGGIGNPVALVYRYDGNYTWTQILNNIGQTNNAIALAALPTANSNGVPHLYMFWGDTDNSNAYACIYDPLSTRWGATMNMPYSMWGAPSATTISSPPRATPTLVLVYNNNNNALQLTYYDNRAWQSLSTMSSTSAQVAIISDPTSACGEIVVAEIDGNGDLVSYRRTDDTGSLTSTSWSLMAPSQIPAMMAAQGVIQACVLDANGQPQCYELI